MRPFFHRVWMLVRWPLAALFLAYAALVAYRIPVVAQKAQSDKAVAYIHAQKITLADVMGQDLPPTPDAKINDATLAGIDANHNGIRDDVELAIFKKYPDSARTRAALLQYAHALQLELTQVTDSNTLVAVSQEEGRAYVCINDRQKSLDIENAVFNTSQRKDFREQNLQKYMVSFALTNNSFCDIDAAALSN